MELEMLVKKLDRIKTDLEATLTAAESVVREMSNDEYLVNMKARAPKQ
jgi:hypothetical protein